MALALCLLGRVPPAWSGGTPDMPGLSDLDDQDEAAYFRSTIERAVTTLDGFILETREGKNLSDFTLGIFVMKLLGSLGRQDVEVSKHLHAGDRFIEGYLVEVFQYHSEDEIRYFNELALQSTLPRTIRLRLATAAALDVLRNIPDGKADQLRQQQDRLDLIKALTALKLHLSALSQMDEN